MIEELQMHVVNRVMLRFGETKSCYMDSWHLQVRGCGTTNTMVEVESWKEWTRKHETGDTVRSSENGKNETPTAQKEKCVNGH
jgi:hypothetical protein